MKEKRFFGFSGNVFFTGLVSLFMDISSEMVYPLVPLFLTGVLGVTKTTVGVIEGLAESTASLLKIFSGWLADLIRRKKLLMLIGYGTSTLSRPLLYGSSTWADVLIARFIDRFGKGIRTPPRDAIIAESTEAQRLGRAFGFHRAMDTVGAMIGPLTATIILAWFWGDIRLVFLISTIPALAAVLLIVFFVKEKRSERENAGELPPLDLKALNGPLGHYVLVIFIFSLGNCSDAFLILRAENLGMEKELIPIAYLLLNSAYALTSIPFGRMADRAGLKKTLIFGFIFYSTIYFLIAMATKESHVWALFILYGIYKGMSNGTQRAYLAQTAPRERLSTAFGVLHGATGLALFPASIIGGVLWDRVGAEATFLYSSLLSLIAGVVFIIPARRT